MEKFEICIKAIIQNKGKILVCFHKKEGVLFLSWRAFRIWRKHS
jgi:hypothetical protein